MTLNPQEEKERQERIYYISHLLKKFSVENSDIIIKKLEIKMKGLCFHYEYGELIDSFGKLVREQQKILEQGIEYCLESDIELFNKNCNNYGIKKEYGKYLYKPDFNKYVELYEYIKEQNIFDIKHPSEKIKELAREEYLIENPIFRGKHITIITKITEDKEQTFISYDDKEYKFDDFLIAMYPKERVNKSVVYFPDTIANLLKIGPTQRIKMKYDILAYHFGLPIISDEEKEDWDIFFNKYYDNDTIQKYYRRFKWNKGIEKMIAFGADLEISGKVNEPIEGFWCYEYRTDKGKAIVTGIDTSLNLWLTGIKADICSLFTLYQLYNKVPNNVEYIKNHCRILLYYQQGRHLALPDIQIGRPIKGVIDFCVDTVCRKMKGKESIDISDIVNKCFSTLSIPDYQSESYQFTVDFEKDVMIVDTKSAARAQQAITKAYAIAAERLTGLKAGDKVTTKQLRDRGYTNKDGRAINTLVKYGVLKNGVLRGNYIMLKDF